MGKLLLQGDARGGATKERPGRLLSERRSRRNLESGGSNLDHVAISPNMVDRSAETEPGGCGVRRQVQWSLSRAVSGVEATVRGAEDQVVVEEMGGEMPITRGVSSLTGDGVTLAGVSEWS